VRTRERGKRERSGFRREKRKEGGSHKVQKERSDLLNSG